MAGWTRVEEIIAYQRGLELRDRILGLIDAGQIPHNFHLRDQMADAARSVPANISEGFDRYKHGQFGYHVGVAKASLGELATHLNEAKRRGFLSDDLFAGLLRLIERTRRPTMGLLRHLATTDAPTPWQAPPAIAVPNTTTPSDSSDTHTDEETQPPN